MQLKLSTQHFKSVTVLHFGLAHLGLRSCRIELYPEIFMRRLKENFALPHAITQPVALLLNTV